MFLWLSLHLQSEDSGIFILEIGSENWLGLLAYVKYFGGEENHVNYNKVIHGPLPRDTAFLAWGAPGDTGDLLLKFKEWMP